jgi:hypothetical protein
MNALIIGNSNMHPLDALQNDPVFLEIASKVPGFDEVEERTARALAFELPDINHVAVAKEQAEEYLRGGDATASVTALLANHDIATRRRVAADLLAHIEGSARETAVRWYASVQKPVSEAYTRELERVRQEATDLFRGPLTNVHGADDLPSHPDAGEAWIEATRLALRFRALAKSAASMLGVSEVDQLPLVHVIDNLEHVWPTYWIANGATIDAGDSGRSYAPQRPTWADATPLDQLRALVDAGAVFLVPTPAGLAERRTRIRIATNVELDKQAAALKREHSRKR